MLSLALLLWIPAVLAVTPAHPALFPFHHSPVGCLRFILASLIHPLIGIPMHEEDFALGVERLQCMILPAYFPLAGSNRGDLQPGSYGSFSLSVRDYYCKHAIDAIKTGTAHAQGKREKRKNVLKH